jgi:hypothetical protein
VTNKKQLYYKFDLSFIAQTRKGVTRTERETSNKSGLRMMFAYMANDAASPCDVSCGNDIVPLAQWTKKYVKRTRIFFVLSFCLILESNFDLFLISF